MLIMLQLFIMLSGILTLAKTGDIVMEFLEKLNEQGKTIIMVTHEPELANAHADVVYWLRDGQLEQVTKGKRAIYKNSKLKTSEKKSKKGGK